MACACVTFQSHSWKLCSNKRFNSSNARICGKQYQLHTIMEIIHTFKTQAASILYPYATTNEEKKCEHILLNSLCIPACLLSMVQWRQKFSATKINSIDLKWVAFFSISFDLMKSNNGLPEAHNISIIIFNDIVSSTEASQHNKFYWGQTIYSMEMYDHFYFVETTFPQILMKTLITIIIIAWEKHPSTSFYFIRFCCHTLHIDMNTLPNTLEMKKKPLVWLCRLSKPLQQKNTTKMTVVRLLNLTEFLSHLAFDHKHFVRQQEWNVETIIHMLMINDWKYRNVFDRLHGVCRNHFKYDLDRHSTLEL